MECDVLIIGAGPAGLSAAIRLKQLDTELNVIVLEKGSAVGSHILSGAVLEPTALNELLPNWHTLDAPLTTLATKDYFLYLTENHAIHLPHPSKIHNKGNYIISLGEFCQWLAQQAENLGVEIFSGFAGSNLIFDGKNKVCGVVTGDVGLDKAGKPTQRYQPGVEIHAKQTLFAEGCYGSLTKRLMMHYNLRQNCQYQTYGIGIKELWEVSADRHQAGLVLHTVGWPLDRKTYGGSFLYHYGKNRVAVGFVVGLDYQNTYLDPFAELQRFKTHPDIRGFFENGKRIGYGSRALTEGGLQSLPKLTFPGGMLIGDTAGFLNVLKIKGIHTAMKSGMIAAECIASAGHEELTNEIKIYQHHIKKSWIYHELKLARNIRPGFKNGLWRGLIYGAIDIYIFQNHAPWTLKNGLANHLSLKYAGQCQKINYPKPDGKLTFDKLSSVYLTNTNHNENQPSHLQLFNPKIMIDINLNHFDSPETRYCPANVYEIVQLQEGVRFQINFSNCIHCKSCDIKDPEQNINWATPEGGDGPNYVGM